MHLFAMGRERERQRAEREKKGVREPVRDCGHRETKMF